MFVYACVREGEKNDIKHLHIIISGSLLSQQFGGRQLRNMVTRIQKVRLCGKILFSQNFKKEVCLKRRNILRGKHGDSWTLEGFNDFPVGESGSIFLFYFLIFTEKVYFVVEAILYERSKPSSKRFRNVINLFSFGQWFNSRYFKLKRTMFQHVCNMYHKIEVNISAYANSSLFCSVSTVLISFTQLLVHFYWVFLCISKSCLNSLQGALTTKVEPHSVESW